MENKKGSIFSSIVLIICIIGAVLFLAFDGISLFTKPQNIDTPVKKELEIEFTLKGSKEITINKGSTFTDPGFNAIGNDGKDYSSEVKVYSNLDVNVPGRYTITYVLNVSSIKKSLSRTIIVVSNEVPITSIDTDKESYSIDVGDSVTIKTTIKPSNATNRTLIWSSSDNKVATVNKGVVKGVSKGTATITIKDSNNNVTKKVKVTVKEIITISFTLKGNKEITLVKGDTFTDPGFNAIGSDGKDYYDKVIVSGKVDTNKVGKYTITYTLDVSSNKKTLTRIVTVVAKAVPVTKINTDKDSYTVDVGDTKVIKTTIEPSDATDKTLIWSSSDKKIVQVLNGKIKGIKKGTATITIKDSSKKVTKKVKVTVKETITINFALKGKKDMTITVGSSFKDPGFKATGSNGKDYSKKVTVTGTVNTKKVGKYIIKYHLKTGSIDKTLTRTVNVVKKVIPVTAIKTNKDSYSIYTGETLTIKTTIEPSNATNKKLIWTSSDTKIATVSDGKVKGVSKGTVTITIEDSSRKVKKTVKVTIKNKPATTIGNKIHFIKQSTSTTSSGDAILLESNGHFAMIDTGLGNADDNKYVYNYLKNVGVKNLDFILITHNHNDHIGGAKYLIDHLNVERLYIKTYLAKDSNSGKNKPRYEKVINEAKAKNVPITYIDKSFTDGKGFKFENMSIKLYNTQQVIHDNENGNTVLEYIKVNGYKVLLTGDLYSYSDNRTFILNLSKKTAFKNLDLLKVPHHGYGSCGFKDNRQAANNMNPKTLIITGSAKVCDQVFSSKIKRYYVKNSSKKAVVVSLDNKLTIDY